MWAWGEQKRREMWAWGELGESKKKRKLRQKAEGKDKKKFNPKRRPVRPGIAQRALVPPLEKKMTADSDIRFSHIVMYSDA